MRHSRKESSSAYLTRKSVSDRLSAVGKTPLAQLAEHKLGRSLTKYVKALQADGLGWRRIAQELHAETGVLISHESLRTWFTQKSAKESDRTAA